MFKVLLVEDDLIAQHVENMMLKKLNCDVYLALKGSDGLKLAENHSPYDLIITDLGLPDLSGFEVIQALRKIPACENTPIIALTGYIYQEEKNAALDAGADEVICKPVSRETLERILAKYV